MTHQGTLFVISAPSGAGKTSLANALVESMSQVERSISHTTRLQRAGEEEGKHYYFVSQQVFGEMLSEGAFLEHAEIFGHVYGTARAQVMERLAQGIDLLLTIDWQGARQVCALFPDAVSIFVVPPSREALRQRLDHRNQDERSVIERRLQEAGGEVSHYREFHYLVVNEVFQMALADLKAIICAARLRVRHQAERYAGLLEKLLS